jgi:hypothetical protein
MRQAYDSALRAEMRSPANLTIGIVFSNAKPDSRKTASIANMAKRLHENWHSFFE